MSLINKMLRDLDQRQATAAERAGLAASQVRALPPERRFPWSRLALVLGGAAIGAAALWLLLDSQGTLPSSVSPAVSPLMPEPEPPASAASAPAIAMPALVVPMPAEVSEAEATPAKPVELASIETLQLDLRLSQPAPVRREPRPATATAKLPADAESAPIDKRLHDASVGSSAEAEYRKAMAMFRQGRVGEALTGFQAALRLDGRHVAARQALLSQFMEQRRWTEAQALAAEGLAGDPAQSGWAMILARLQVEQGQLAEAQETLARHAGHAERSPDYQAFHALLLQKLQRPKEALERYRAAVALRPGEGRWWYGLGLALDADQRPQEAREAFRQSLEAGNLPAELAAGVEHRLR